MTLRLPALFLVAVLVSGCSTMGDSFKTEDYHASLSATGIVPVAPVSLGKIPVPQNGEGLIALAVFIAGKHLASQYNLKSCLFETYPARLVGRRIEVTATAICKLEGVPVQESIVLALDPAVS